MHFVTEIVVTLAGLGLGIVGILLFGFDSYIPLALTRRKWPSGTAGVAAIISLAVGVAADSAVCRLVALGLALSTACLCIARRRDEEKPSRIVLHRSLLSPGTNFERENVDARWVETRDRLIFFIREEDWSEIPAATHETRVWLEQFSLAPGLYSTPSDNDTLQLVDSLQLYRFLLSSDHDAAVSEFARLLAEPPSVAPAPPLITAPAPVRIVESVATSSTSVPHQQELVAEPTPRKRRAKTKISASESHPVVPGQELFFGPPPASSTQTSPAEPTSETNK